MNFFTVSMSAFFRSAKELLKSGIDLITGGNHSFDKKKDMIVLRNGKKVFPEEIEVLINRLEEVEESFVYGMPSKDDPNDIKIAAEVVVNKTAFKSKHPDLTEKDYHDVIWNEIKEINKILPIYKYIKHLSLSNEPLIKTTTNKIKRKEELKKVLERK